MIVAAVVLAILVVAAVVFLVTRGGEAPPPPPARAIPEGILVTVTDGTVKPATNSLSIADPVDGGLAPFSGIGGTDPEWLPPGRVAYQPEDGGDPVTVPYFHPNDPDRTRTISVPGDATSFDLAPDGSLAYTTGDCVCARGPSGDPVFTLGGLILPLGVSWSPDGSRIAYLASGAKPGDDPGAFQLWVVDVDGTPRPSQRTDETYGLEDYAWAPDGRSIAYSAHNPDTSPTGATDLFTVSVTGAAQRNQLTTDPNPERSPTWSPDGSRIAYVREAPGGTEIRVMTADGNDDALLVPTRVGLSYGSLDWGPPGPADTGATAGPP